MLCRRCRGLLVRDTFGELNIETNSLDTAIRCINCGCIEDAVVRANHLRSLVRTRAIPRRMARKGEVVFSEPDSPSSVSIR
jgi:RNase P subunit RPR2